jgi:hypothetical protein
MASNLVAARAVSQRTLPKLSAQFSSLKSNERENKMTWMTATLGAPIRVAKYLKNGLHCVKLVLACIAL